ncbi:hypothetical protein [Desertivibrio insolitus]|uniref:hypothetical protein n=1 Tax=Herbiconiux sp. SYSU D00978 TaxID=2812562 RepID=UPI001F625F47|nr:hypothetical protein [Herbiconiux sp. SYSU D00978]
MTGAGEDRRPRRTLVLVLLAALALAFAATVTALNLTLYSASGFVSGYLQALARGDAEGALTTPGVELPDGADDALAATGALSGPRGIRITNVADASDGTRAVTAEYSLAGSTHRTRFTITPESALLGLFARWSFVDSPVATLEITPRGIDDYEVGTVTVTDAAAPAAYAVLVPAAYELDHESRLVTTDDVEVAVTEPASTVRTELQAQASEEFVGLIQEQLESYLDEQCATQEVLQPTGCPFGRVIGDRIRGVPRWSIAQYPQVSLQPGAAPGEWVMPAASGAAHLVVEVVSIFDGTVSTLDEDVPFQVAYTITVGDDGGIDIRAS